MYSLKLLFDNILLKPHVSFVFDSDIDNIDSAGTLDRDYRYTYNR